MGFGIGVGPRIFRVRVSTRGVGLSSGIGPFSVWTSTGGRRRRSRSYPSNSRTVSHRAPNQPRPPAYNPLNDIPMADVTGVDAGQLAPSSSADLIQELNDLVRPAVWPWILAGALIVALFTRGLGWVPLIVLVIGVALTIAFGVLRARHKVSLDYEVEGAIADWHSGVRNRWPEVARLDAVWRVAAQGATQTLHHQKINAGAGHVVSRHRVTVRSSPHARVKSNIDLPTLVGGKHSISFLPDHILVRSGSSWSDLDYSDLRLSYHQQRFIEDGAVPGDSQRVGTTWKYVNKNGGPDRRFNNNRQLPVMLYGEVELTTPMGLRWMLQLSRPETAAIMVTTLQAHPSLKAAER
jgi:hypothetical protein